MVRLISTFASLCSCGSGRSFVTQAEQIAFLSILLRQPLPCCSPFTWSAVRLSSTHSSHVMSENSIEAPELVNEVEDRINWLVVGDGDLSYSSMIASDAFLDKTTRLIATVLEEEERHNQIYERSRENSRKILTQIEHQVKFGVDGTKLLCHFPDLRFDIIEFNFPHWRGKTNAKRNRELMDGFLKSAGSVLKASGEIRIALCNGQGGMPADALQGWRQSWMPAMYAAEHGLLLTRLEPYKPKYGLSSHRGVDRPFFIGENPQRYYFQFPNGNAVAEGLQMSCRHELRIMLHPERLENSTIDYKSIVYDNAVFELGQEFIPEGIRFEIAAQNLLTPYKSKNEHVPLALFLLNYSGESQPLTRSVADEIRDNIEKEITHRWGLHVAKGGRLVSRPYPYHLLPKLIKEYD